MVSVCPWNCLERVLAKLQYRDVTELMPPLRPVLEEKTGGNMGVCLFMLGTEPLWHSIRGYGWGIP